MAFRVTTKTVVSYTAFPPLPKRFGAHAPNAWESRCASFPNRNLPIGVFRVAGFPNRTLPIGASRCASFPNRQTVVAVYFCCTGLGVASTGRYPASCPVKPGLSSPASFRSLQLRSPALLTNENAPCDGPRPRRSPALRRKGRSARPPHRCALSVYQASAQHDRRSGAFVFLL